MKSNFLFERLGYKMREEKSLNYIEFIQRNEIAKETYVISFDTKWKTIMAWIVKDGEKESRALAMNIHEIMAIEIQIRMMGWLDLEEEIEDDD